MASSRKSLSSNPSSGRAEDPQHARASAVQSSQPSALAHRIDKFLSTHTRPGQRLLIAFSGGLDSRVLLQLLAQCSQQHGVLLEAMHVHHGLSPNADRWAAFCAAECQGLGIAFHCQRICVDTSSGLGIEAGARLARYTALLSHDADYVLLAHHQDDQAETLLLQLLRGAGAKGLAAMAIHDPSRRLLRPLIDVSRDEIQAYAKHAGLQWVDDESNLDTRYDRNFLRHMVFPVLAQRYPAVRSTLARSAAHLAEAACLLDELAALDADGMVVDGKVNVDRLGMLSSQRARNLLRWWLDAHGLPMPGLPRLQEMLQQLLHAGGQAAIKIRVCESTYLRRYRGWASLSAEPPVPEPAGLCWQGGDRLLLPANGQLMARHVMGDGLAISRWQGCRLDIRYRSGGERFRLDARRPSRTLKQLFQEADIAPWLRERLPLIYIEDELVLVPGVGVAAGWRAQPGEQGLMLDWQPLRPSRDEPFRH
ncbi:tRNA lysidine(34) synthetase TilS [Methylobacillus flagellatus]|uniref:tRNA lysidine(34) synthetase TilS n=1 Tax=Methylobacillus flagellatus TaxID=405 RepID=UPI0000542C56|nr:tRNA lysidine(34) synthetase TilS [Methylobacillus flagellatus]